VAFFVLDQAAANFALAKALLAPTTTLQDVLFSFYSWLDQHPSETLLMSFKLEGGTGTPRDEKLEGMVYDAFSKATNQDPNSFVKAKYWYERRGSVSHTPAAVRSSLS
jgi:1-phosphatidylinositol phosphodiesterase